MNQLGPCDLALQPPGRAVRNGSARAPARRQVKRHEEWLVQRYKLFPKLQGCSPSHSKCRTYFCVRAAGTQPTPGHLLQHRGGGKWVVTGSKVLGVGVLRWSAPAFSEHTFVSGRLQGGRWPTGEHLTQVTHETASLHTHSWLYKE